MKIKKFLPIVLTIVSLADQASAQQKVLLTLKESTQMGIERNVNVKNARLDNSKIHYQLKEAQSKLYPQLEGFSTFNYYYAIPKMILPGEIFGQTGLIPVEIGTTFDWSNGFKATQVLYNQSYFTSLKLSKRMETFGTLSLQQKKEELVYQVTQVYYLCQATGKQIEQLKLTMQNTNKLLDVAKQQNENGVIRKIDYSRVLVSKNNMQTQIDNLDQLEQQQIGLLKYCIGLPVETEVELADSLSLPLTQLTPENPNFSNRTELALIDKQIEINKLKVKINRNTYLPTLSGFGQLYYEGQQNTFNYFKDGDGKFFKTGFFGISLNVPLFDGFEKYAKTKQYDIELQQLQNTRKNTQDYFTKQFTDAYRQYQNCLKTLAREQENQKMAEETYKVSLLGYGQQVVSLTDLLLSENSLTESHLAYFNALLQLKNAELEVKKSKGELLNNQ